MQVATILVPRRGHPRLAETRLSEALGLSGGPPNSIAGAWQCVPRSRSIDPGLYGKAAETTSRPSLHAHRFGAADASSAGYITTPGQARTSVVGNTAYTTYSPGMVHQYMKPGQDVYIRVLTITPGQPPPPGAFSADEIIQFVGSRVKRATERAPAQPIHELGLAAASAPPGAR